MLLLFSDVSKASEEKGKENVSPTSPEVETVRPGETPQDLEQRREHKKRITDIEVG